MGQNRKKIRLCLARLLPEGTDLKPSPPREANEPKILRAFSSSVRRFPFPPPHSKARTQRPVRPPARRPIAAAGTSPRVAAGPAPLFAMETGHRPTLQSLLCFAWVAATFPIVVAALPIPAAAGGRLVHRLLAAFSSRGKTVRPSSSSSSSKAVRSVASCGTSSLLRLTFALILC